MRNPKNRRALGLAIALVFTLSVSLVLMLRDAKVPIATAISDAEQLHNSGKPFEAIHLLETVVGDYDDGARLPIYGHLARWNRDVGQLDAASFYFRLATGKGAVDVDLQRELVEISVLLNRTGEAKSQLKKYPLLASDVELEKLVAALEYTPENAENVYIELLGRKPDYVEASVLLARQLLSQQKLSDASGVLGAALNHNPGNITLLRLAGDVSYLQRDFAASKQFFFQVTDIFPDAKLSQDHVNLARAMLYSEQFDEANELLRRYLKVYPHDVGGRFFLALGSFRASEYERAYSYAKDLALEYPTWKDCSLLAGSSALALGKLEKAELYLSRFSADEPEQHIGRRLWDYYQQHLSPAIGEGTYVVQQVEISDGLKGLLQQVLR